VPKTKAARVTVVVREPTVPAELVHWCLGTCAERALQAGERVSAVETEITCEECLLTLTDWAYQRIRENDASYHARCLEAEEAAEQALMLREEIAWLREEITQYDSAKAQLDDLRHRRAAAREHPRCRFAETSRTCRTRMGTGDARAVARRRSAGYFLAWSSSPIFW
jgi:hypothetical protein